MSTKTKIAAFATLATLIAAPALAGDQDSATLLQDSGRYVPQAQTLINVPHGAYASAQRAVNGNPNVQRDFQLDGR
jgi:hypothetical protein